MFTDFKYDSIYASDFKLLPCVFDSSSSGATTYSVGAELNYNNVSVRHGEIQFITDVSYDATLEMTFQVCKFTCEEQVTPFTFEERRKITRWLNRNENHKLKLIGDDPAYEYIYFNGVFNVKEIRVNDDVLGFELTFISDHPYALHNPIKRTINATEQNYVYTLYDPSDKIGYIYPNLKIRFTEDVDRLTIHNSIEDRTTVLKGCSKGEEVFIDENLQISTTNLNHKIQNDFNYRFFRIANTYNNRENKITVSNPCEIKIEYSPIIKGVGF